MRYRKLRRHQERTKTILFGGGLNSTVTTLELKEGELYKSVNYTEVDSPYQGYTSVSGYEVYDGKTKPSKIPIEIMIDEGNDSNTTFLMEAASGAVDLSSKFNIVSNFGVVVNQGVTKFDDGSFDIGGGSYIRVVDWDAGQFSTAFSSAFYATHGESTHLSRDFTIDIQLRPKVRKTKEVILEKEGTIRISLDVAGYIEVEIASTDTSGYDYSLKMENRALNDSLFTHISITSRNKVLRMAIDGLPIEDDLGDVLETAYPSIYNSFLPTYIGRDAAGLMPFSGFFDELRLSDMSRWHTEFEPPIYRYSDPLYSQVNYYDKEREDQRAAITEVPGSGKVTGVHVYNNKVYALRNNLAGDGAALYRADTVYMGDGITIDDVQSGWTLIDDTFNPDGRLYAVNWRFSGSFGDKQVMCMVDGVSIPRIYNSFDDTMYILDNIEADGIPDRQVPPRFSHICAIFDNRLVLGYHENDIVLSSKTDPRDFTGGYGDQLLIGDDITNMRDLPGEALGIFCRNSVKVLDKLQNPTSSPGSPDFTFKVDNFSREAGALSFTCDRVLNHLIYADDRGVVSFSASDKYGDFAAASISKNLNNIYLFKKGQVTCSLVEKQVGQYRLFFDDNTSLWFTFRSDGELKGGSFVEYVNPVLITTYGEDVEGGLIKFFASDDGFVYQMDSGTSFNGEEILAEFFSSFFHYSTPRNWKTFRRLEFEASAEKGTKFHIRPVFNYDSTDLPTTNWWNPDIEGFSGIWGVDEWGQFVWGRSVIQTAIHYMRGVGRNMSIELRTVSKYLAPHIVHNVIVDYELNDQQQ